MVEVSDAAVAAALDQGNNPGAEPPGGQSTPSRDPKPKARKRRANEPSGAEKKRKREEREREGKGTSSRRSTPASATSIKALERGLAQTLTAPALPAAMLPLPVDTKLFMVGHFTSAGPATAHQLAQAAEQSPELRELLERANRGSATLTLLMAGAIYLAPVVLWTIGMREAAAMGSALASADPDQLAAQAEGMQEAMAEAMAAATMAGANGGAAQQQGAQEPQHQGAEEPPPSAEPPPAL